MLPDPQCKIIMQAACIPGSQPASRRSLVSPLRVFSLVPSLRILPSPVFLSLLLFSSYFASFVIFLSSSHLPLLVFLFSPLFSLSRLTSLLSLPRLFSHTPPLTSTSRPSFRLRRGAFLPWCLCSFGFLLVFYPSLLPSVSFVSFFLIFLFPNFLKTSNRRAGLTHTTRQRTQAHRYTQAYRYTRVHAGGRA